MKEFCRSEEHYPNTGHHYREAGTPRCLDTTLQVHFADSNPRHPPLSLIFKTSFTLLTNTHILDTVFLNWEPEGTVKNGEETAETGVSKC